MNRENKMEEIYRSFEGLLDVKNQTGYIVYELKDFYEIEFLSVWSNAKESRVRIRKNLLKESDFSNLEKIGALQMDIENGRGDFGQCYFNEKWYGYETIRKIQAKYDDNNWKRHISR